MRVREKRAAPRHKWTQGQPTEKVPTESYTFPAPINGWVLSESLVTPKPGSARVLDNFICTTTGIRPRGGKSKHATLEDDVTSLWTYKVGAAETLFGATGAKIYDITSPADPDVAPSAEVSGQASGYYSTEQFGTAGGDYLYACNGDDSPQLYDGSSWTAITGASSPAITGVTTSGLSHVWSYASRLFFVEKDTMSAWYLGVDSIGGAASQFSLAGIFKHGGALLFGATWSVDAGDGLDDKCVFVSTEGEVAVYSGTNPGSASDWSKQGLYRIPKPMGKNAHISTGGELLIATEIGLIPISAVLQNDIATLENKAFSQNIAKHWQDRTATASTVQWEMAKDAANGLLYTSVPDVVDGEALCMNLQTGAWSRMVGWDVQCLAQFGDNVFSGAADNAVYQLDTTGADAGTPYTCVYLGQHEALGVYGRQKTSRQAKALFKAGTPVNAKVTVLADYSEEMPSPPNSPAEFTADVWDTAVWETAVWDAGSSATAQGRWVSAAATGAVIAPAVQLTFGNTVQPNVELVSIDVQYHVGATVA